MKTWMALFAIGLGTMWLVCIGPSRTCAEIVYNQHSYEQLADAIRPKGFPVGTKISSQNWERYTKFMSVQCRLDSGHFLSESKCHNHDEGLAFAATEIPDVGDEVKSISRAGPAGGADHGRG